MGVDDRLRASCTSAVRELLAQRVPAGHWRGRLSDSALSTATALCALELGRRHDQGRSDTLGQSVEKARSWLLHHQNPDGGWGDTPDSPSNISTTTLAWAALRQSLGDSASREVSAAEDWIEERAGGLDPASISRFLTRQYGDDRTFSVPILSLCALAGRFGKGRSAWATIPVLPFELAVFPHSLFRFLGLPVVSYALPALIAIGQAQHHHAPSWNPLLRMLRQLARARTLRVLARSQPESGGFLEAIPLTSFVTMCLISMGLIRHSVAAKGIQFLLGSQRPDGSWPIDVDLSCWVTSLAVQALASGGRLEQHLPPSDRTRVASWLADQQRSTRDPYSHAAPGGWPWTDLPGGVPDADDTSAALIAIHRLADSGAIPPSAAVKAALAGIQWLLDLQNRDGGLPTFCRGWGKLEFDRSAPDLTAHALRAWQLWKKRLPPEMLPRVDSATRRAVEFLLQCQRPDGAWIPLWFGNQSHPTKENPVYGSSRVLLAAQIIEPESSQGSPWATACRRCVAWLLSVQNSDGGWGAGAGVPSSLEETALALEGLIAGQPAPQQATEQSILAGRNWLIEASDHGRRFEAAPIGLYFAQLWYSERLYPLIFSVAALERIAHYQSRKSRPFAGASSLASTGRDHEK